MINLYIIIFHIDSEAIQTTPFISTSINFLMYLIKDIVHAGVYK
jgi:hypothetical protein